MTELQEKIESEHDNGYGPATNFISTSGRDAPVVDKLNALFAEALQNNYSDLHIETQHKDGSMRVRVRIDGELETIHCFEPSYTHVVLNKIRSRSRLSSSDIRAPQDGRFLQVASNKRADVRVSILATGHDGSSVVMRLLDSDNAGRSIDSLEMQKLVHDAFIRALHRHEGMVLATGPTGSGKTTTLYAGLNYRNKPSEKLLTIEDPIEYQLEGAQQVQVGTGTGRTFASALRAALRQDPDVILVGEMRDTETAEIAARAALTGHIVLSTLHANSAVDTVIRLMDMGLPLHVIKSSLLLVVAQRLVRTVCKVCSHPRALIPGDLEMFQLYGITPPRHVTQVVGCEHCRRTGYKGRVAIFETIVLTPDFAASMPDHIQMKEAAKLQPQYEPLAVAAMRKAAEGITTLEEANEIAYT
jgi:type II secretory ATPase GspE/PulE/Tfp pilus assembly ATPase PilB-like protein